MVQNLEYKKRNVSTSVLSPAFTVDNEVIIKLAIGNHLSSTFYTD